MVMVVVPAFAEGDQGEEEVVAAVVCGVVAAAAVHVGERVDGEGGVPDEDGTPEESDDEAGGAHPEEGAEGEG